MWAGADICKWRDSVQPQTPPRPTLANPTRKRPLSVMSSNIQTTPRKSQRLSKDLQPHLATPDKGTDDDVETPRPLTLTTLPPTSRTPIDPIGLPFDNVTISSNDSSISGATSSVGTDKGKRKRSPSPRKEMVQRQYASYPIKYCSVEDLDLVNHHIRDTIKRVKRIGRGKGLFTGPSDDDMLDQVCMGDQDLKRDVVDDGDMRYGEAPAVPRMRRIVDRAKRNVQLGVVEAAWNSGVHDFLLEEACSRSSVVNDLTWENITTASILPQSVPFDDWDQRVKPKKVDFCIALEMREYANLGQRLRKKEIHCLNPTSYGAVQYKPIAISIETKSENESGQSALPQLSTWAATHVAYLHHLRGLAGSGARDDSKLEIPPLPLLVAQGHSWSMYYLEHLSRTEGAILWSCGQLGTTETLFGAYQITTTLQVVMHWARHVYQPWFEEHILRRLGFDANEGG